MKKNLFVLLALLLALDYNEPFRFGAFAGAPTP